MSIELGLKKIATRIERRGRLESAAINSIEDAISTAALSAIILGGYGKYKGIRSLGYGMGKLIKSGPTKAMKIIRKAKRPKDMGSLAESAILTGLLGGAFGATEGFLRPEYKMIDE